MVRLVAIRLRLGRVGLRAAAVAASTNTRRAMVFNDDYLVLPAVCAARSCLLSAYKPRKALLRTCYLYFSARSQRTLRSRQGSDGGVFEA